MAVSALPRTRASAPLHASALSPFVLVLTLVPPALDLLRMVQPGVGLTLAGVLAASTATALLLLTWARFPRTAWLAAAALAMSASLAMRLGGADVAPALSLLSVVALGIGGAFASPRREAEAWLA